jgi:hypothetical protein
VSRSAERLPRHAAGEEIDVVKPPDLQRVEELGRVGEIPTPRHPAEIRVMGADRPFVDVGADEHIETGAFEPEREGPGPAEEVDRRRARS